MATDDFNRANADTAGANWTAQSGESLFGIQDNGADGTNIFGINGGIYTAASPTNGDHYSQATVVSLSFRRQAVRVRCQSGARTYYAAGKNNTDFSSSNTYVIWKVVAGTATQLAMHASQAMAAGDVVRLTASGTTLTLSVDGTDILSATDSDISGGSWGLGITDGSTDAARWDDWEGGQSVGGGVTGRGPLVRGKLVGGILVRPM